MCKVLSIYDKRKALRIDARTRLRGDLKDTFLNDLEKGEEKECDIVSKALRFYYLHNPVVKR